MTQGPQGWPTVNLGKRERNKPGRRADKEHGKDRKGKKKVEDDDHGLVQGQDTEGRLWLVLRWC